jgi:hypothetical protein
MVALHRSLPVREQDAEPAAASFVAVQWATFIAALMVSFLLYLRTMAPTVYGLDSAELTAGAYLLGIVHAPGSPTFMLLGHLFTWLPFGDIGYRVNLLSAASAALAIGFVCAVLRQLTGRPYLSLAGALYLGTTYYFWISAVAAELYALHAAFIGVLLWLALRWRRQRRTATLLLFFVLFGLGLGNHLTLAVLAPGFAVLLASGPGEIRRPHTLVAAAMCLAAGCAVYLYLPLRAAAGVDMNYCRDFGVDVTTWSGFWWTVSGRMFGKQMLGMSLNEIPSELWSYVYHLWSNFVGLGFFLGIIGLWVDWRRQPQVHTSLLLMFVGHLGFILTYDVADKDLMLLPTFLVWGIWSALGAGVVARFVSKGSPELFISAAMLLSIMSLGNVVLNFARVDVSQDWSARHRGELLMRWLPVDSLYLATWADAPIVDYFQLVEGRRSDIKLANIFLVRGRRRQALVEEQWRRGKPVYATTPLELKRRFVFEYQEDCDCYRVLRSSQPACVAGPPRPLRCQPALTHGVQ